jgi:hypothetical protein
MPEVDMPVQLFGAVDIQHRDWLGGQTVHADPFPKPKTRMVHYAYVHILSNIYKIHTYTYTNSIFKYMLVYACICQYMVCIRTYMYG